MPAELPKTPVGRHLGWVLDALRTPPPANEVATRFAGDLQRRLPPATFVQVMEQRGNELKGFVLDGFELEKQREVVAVLATPDGKRYRLSIAVDHQQITDLAIT